MSIRDDHEAMAALRALRDLTVVRAHFDHPGYRDLRARGVVSVSRTRRPQYLDFRLNHWGMNLIGKVLP